MAKVFRLFISSTFQDWQVEREYLRNHVFPRLKSMCEKQGARFLPVDLRWGISEEAAQTHETVAICLEEIERCQKLTTRPNFLILAGDRYGWRPVPSKISSVHWQNLAKLGVIADGDLFHDWYVEDENAVPSVYVLKPRDLAWQQAEPELRRRLDESYLENEAAWSEAFAEDERAFLIGSVTEQEIVRGALKAADAAGHVHFFDRRLEGEVRSPAFADFDEAGEEDRLAKHCLDRLKERLSNALPESNCHIMRPRFDDSWIAGERPEVYLEAFGNDVFRFLRSIIEAELGRLGPQPDHLPLDACIGREREIETLLANASGPMLVYGKPGAGKSTLLAETARRLSEANAPLLAYWVGRDPRCASGSGLIKAILDDLRGLAWVDDAFDWDGDYSLKGFPELVMLLQDVMRHLVESKRNGLRIVVDGVDQLPVHDPAKDMAWIDEGMGMLLSTLDERQSLLFGDRFGQASVVRLGRLDDASAKQVLDHWLEHERRSLLSIQFDAVISAFRHSGMPLHLRLLFHDARRWRSFDAHPTTLPANADEAIHGLFDRLAGGTDHGAAMVMRTLAYLVSFPYGASEEQLLLLLRLDAHVVASFRQRSPRSPAIDALPEIVWSRLYHDLEPFLAIRQLHNEQLIDFYHMQFRRVAERWISAAVMKQCRRNVAAMLLRNWGARGPKTAGIVLRELVPALERAGETDELYAIARNSHFLNLQDRQSLALSDSTYELALHHAIQKRKPFEMADFLISRAIRSENISRLSPLGLLVQTGKLDDAFRLADFLRPEISSLWYLVMALYLHREGKIAQAEIAIAMMDRRKKVGFGAGSKGKGMGVTLMHMLYRAGVVSIKRLPIRDQVAALLQKGDLGSAFSVAEAAQGEAKVWCLIDIAHTCADAENEFLFNQCIDEIKVQFESLIDYYENSPDWACLFMDPTLDGLYQDVFSEPACKSTAMAELDSAITKSIGEMNEVMHGYIAEDMGNVRRLIADGRFDDALDMALSISSTVNRESVIKVMAEHACDVYCHGKKHEGTSYFKALTDRVSGLGNREKASIYNQIAVFLVKSGEDAWARDIVRESAHGEQYIIKGLVASGRLTEGYRALNVLNNTEVRVALSIEIARSYYQRNQKEHALNLISEAYEEAVSAALPQCVYQLYEQLLQWDEGDNALFFKALETLLNSEHFLFSEALGSPVKREAVCIDQEICRILIALRRYRQVPEHYKGIRSTKGRHVILALLMRQGHEDTGKVRDCLTRIARMERLHFALEEEGWGQKCLQILCLGEAFSLLGDQDKAKEMLLDLVGYESIEDDPRDLGQLTPVMINEYAASFANEHWNDTHILSRAAHLFDSIGFSQVAESMLEVVSKKIADGDDSVFINDGDANDKMMLVTTALMRIDPDRFAVGDHVNSVLRSLSRQPPFEANALDNMLEIIQALIALGHRDEVESLLQNAVNEAVAIEYDDPNAALLKVVKVMASAGSYSMAINAAMKIASENHRMQALAEITLKSLSMEPNSTIAVKALKASEDCFQSVSTLSAEAMLSFLRVVATANQHEKALAIKDMLLAHAESNEIGLRRAEILNALAGVLIELGMLDPALEVMGRIPKYNIAPQVLMSFPGDADAFDQLLMHTLCPDDAYRLSSSIAMKSPGHASKIIERMGATAG